VVLFLMQGEGKRKKGKVVREREMVGEGDEEEEGIFRPLWLKPRFAAGLGSS